MLPIIRIGSQSFYNMSGIISPRRYTRYATRRVNVHHAVGPNGDFPDLNFNGTSQDEEVAFIKQINAQHLASQLLGFSGFGYNAIVFPSANVYVDGDSFGARAHVAGLNGESVGIVGPGDYRTLTPQLGVLFGIARFTLAQFETHGLIPLEPHRVSPGQQTVCPGDKMVEYIPAILGMVAWLHRTQTGGM